MWQVALRRFRVFADNTADAALGFPGHWDPILHKVPAKTSFFLRQIALLAPRRFGK